MKNTGNDAKRISAQITTEAQMHKHAIILCINDLRLAFEYVEPHDDNVDVFSHRFYELLLRGCTEFESLCKTLLKKSGISFSDDGNIKDYFHLTELINQLRLSGMIVKRWNPYPRAWFPFADWNDQNTGPSWYRAYNRVKHSRREEFPKANLQNTILAISACVALLCEAYGDNFLSSSPQVHVYADENGSVVVYDELDLGYAKKVSP